ncbi:MULTISPECIES: hypothetical protein [unclassified Streptomyces]|uniref:hypothetical protein n=1 Tax=unclassified Streptomyces TaxID=2593676 RepID=UPI002E2DF948|nr:hypothetical protein [Streptomyces sp. NBC_01429]
MGRVRGRVRVLGGVLAVALVSVGCGASAVAEDDRDPSGREAKPVPCAEAMEFADLGGLPEGASEATCVTMSALDTYYDVGFRIPRADFDTWLAAAHPGTKLTPSCAGEHVDACAQIQLDPPAEGGAVAIDVRVENKEGGNALVHLRPFNT